MASYTRFDNNSACGGVIHFPSALKAEPFTARSGRWEIDIAASSAIKESYYSALLDKLFFDIVKQTVQHCGVALLK